MDLTSDEDEDASSLSLDSSEILVPVPLSFYWRMMHSSQRLHHADPHGPDDDSDADSVSSRSTGQPNSDEELEDAEDEDGFTSACLLNWRMSPQLSRSDWVVEIVHASSSNSSNNNHSTNKTVLDTYHVHQVILTVGPYRSRTLAQLDLRTATTPERTVTTTAAAPACSRFVLPAAAAVSFPQFLDFIYAKAMVGWEHDLRHHLTSSNAFRLWYLADFFDVPTLRRRARAYAKHDMAIHRGAISDYCTLAITLGHEGMLQLVENAVAKGLEYIRDYSRLAQTLDLDLLQRVVTSDYMLDQRNDTSCRGRLTAKVARDSNGKTRLKWTRQGPGHVFLSTPRYKSYPLSKLIACFCEQHTVTPEEFLSLTNEELLPFIHPDVRTKLRDLEADIFAAASKPNPLSILGRCSDNESPVVDHLLHRLGEGQDRHDDDDDGEFWYI